MWAVCIIINGFRMQISFIVFQLHQNFNRSLARSNPRCQVQKVSGGPFYPAIAIDHELLGRAARYLFANCYYPHDLDSCVVRDAPTSRRIHQ